jgi:hypothetical protein
MAALVGAALAWASTLAPGISAAETAPGIDRDAALLRTVQYYGQRPSSLGWERRARDEARIAAAARREAHRIQQERAHRRAWHHAERNRYGHYHSW